MGIYTLNHIDKLKDRKYFVADTILAKHDENYMPPEVKDALEKSNN